MDLRLVADAAALDAERAKMREPPELRAASQNAAAAEQQLTGGRTALAAAELDVAAVAAKKQEVHTRLYSGRVTVPRELAALEAEEEALARKQAELEEHQLELMAGVEKAEQALAAARREAEEQLAQWRQEGGAAHAHVPLLEVALESLKQQRQEAAASIDAALLTSYERLKLRKANRAVALVEHNLCQGCGVALPSSEVQRARGAEPPLLCSNCGRMLYVR